MTADPRADIGSARVLVLGLGVTGVATARTLAATGCVVYASEAETGVSSADIDLLLGLGVEVEVGSHDRALAWTEGVDFVVPSPGIPQRADVLGAVRERQVPIVSQLDLGQRLASADVIAVTGTNGKTTIVRALEMVLQETGLRAVACGNVEVPFIAAAATHPDAHVFVVEASSFGLAFCRSFHPRVAIFSNLAPDHLDWHESFAGYRAAKARIAQNQQEGDVFIFPAEQPELAEVAPSGPTRLAFTGRPDSSADAWVDTETVHVSWLESEVEVDAASLIARGPHFAEDAAAVVTAAVVSGAGALAIGDGLSRFTPDPHRLDLVGSLGGVSYYDDSKATNAHATLAALRMFDRVVLICGGLDRSLDLERLLTEARRVRAVIAMGTAAETLTALFDARGVEVTRAQSMASAVETARGLAEPGDVVLLSPACASLDAYVSYAERGRAFVEACRQAGVTP